MWKIKLAVVTLQTIIVLAHDKGFLWSRVQKYFKKLFGIQKPELTTNSTVDLLPKEIWVQIFDKLDLKSLLNVMSVCREWKSIVDSNVFWKEYYNNWYAKRSLPTPEELSQTVTFFHDTSPNYSWRWHVEDDWIAEVRGTRLLSVTPASLRVLWDFLKKQYHDHPTCFLIVKVRLTVKGLTLLHLLSPDAAVTRGYALHNSFDHLLKSKRPFLPGDEIEIIGSLSPRYFEKIYRVRVLHRPFINHVLAFLPEGTTWISCSLLLSFLLPSFLSTQHSYLFIPVAYFPILFHLIAPFTVTSVFNLRRHRRRFTSIVSNLTCWMVHVIQSILIIKNLPFTVSVVGTQMKTVLGYGYLKLLQNTWKKPNTRSLLLKSLPLLATSWIISVIQCNFFHNFLNPNVWKRQLIQSVTAYVWPFTLINFVNIIESIQNIRFGTSLKEQLRNWRLILSMKAIKKDFWIHVLIFVGLVGFSTVKSAK